MTREEAIQILSTRDWSGMLCGYTGGYTEALEIAIKALEQEPCEDKGEISDGYHTFNQLYHQRAVLFATIVSQNKNKSWKSYKHSDGQYCFDSNGEWFIVGIDTPQGTYTYHYSKEYWNMFDCQELECGKEWDGHTEEDVIRLLSLQQDSCEDAVSREAVIKIVEQYPVIIGNRYSGLIADIEHLPSVTPKAKIGHWIDDGFYAEGHSEHAYRCSECDENYIGYVGEFKYCPKCGAKMVKE